MKSTTIVQAGKEPPALKMVRKVLLICGILSSVLYIGTDILAVMRWEAYSYTSQSVSELMAIEAPTRPLVVSLFTMYNLLVIAFGFGVLATDRQKRILRFTGILLIGYGILGQVALLFFPMHLRGSEKTISDTMHIVFTVVIVLFLLSIIGFGAAALGKRFRFYSIGTILILLLFGALAGRQGPRVAALLPTPGLGVLERVNIYTSLLWVLALAVILLRAERGPGLMKSIGT